MVSWLHQSHLLLFRNQPALAAELMREAERLLAARTLGEALGTT
jgi:hypothetical protein